MRYIGLVESKREMFASTHASAYLCTASTLAAQVYQIQSRREGDGGIAPGPKAQRGLITPNASWSGGPLEVNQQYFSKFVSRPKKFSARFPHRGPHLPLLHRGPQKSP